MTFCAYFCSLSELKLAIAPLDPGRWRQFAPHNYVFLLFSKTKAVLFCFFQVLMARLDLFLGDIRLHLGLIAILVPVKISEQPEDTIWPITREGNNLDLTAT